MNRRWICNDVWMDIFPSFDHAQLGLKLALLSPRFDALVDKHFDGKTEFTIWRPIEIRKDKGPETKLFVRFDDGFVPFPLPDRPLPSKIRFKRLEIKYIDHSIIAFLRANHQTFDKRGTNLELLFPSSADTDGPPIWDVFVREIWPIFSPNIHHLVFNDDDDHLDNLRRRTSPTILTDLLNLNSIDSYELLPAAIGDDFDVQNATISAGQALTKWLLTPRKDGQPKRLLCEDYSEQADFDWVNIFKEHFLRATISSVSYEIRFTVRVPSIQMVPFELVNEWTKEKLTLAIAIEHEKYNCWIMNRCKFGEEAVAVQQQKKIDEKSINNFDIAIEHDRYNCWIMNRCKFGEEAVAVQQQQKKIDEKWINNFDMAFQQQRKLDEKWINNCNRVSFWLDIGTNCIGPLSAPPSAEEDEEANDLLKLQGEFAVRLRHLEKALLNALNESKGKILDDDSVIATLEKLKNEAQEVAKKSAETDQVMKEVEIVSQKYYKLANACSLIYLMLHRLDEIHLLYNYSLDFLLDIFTTVLKSPQLGNVKDYDARLSIILQNLFSVMYSRVSMGMLHNDQILLASLLLRIYSRCCGAENAYEQELEQLTALPPEQVLSSAHMLMTKAFGSEFMQQDKVVNLREIILNEVQCKVPVLLCSATGYDVSNRVEDLAFELKMDILSIALGSAEGFEQADKALHSTSRSGRWILLKNVHLATEWLTQLEKKFRLHNPHPHFRLILTAEIGSALPISMIQASRVLVFEPSTGLKANLLRSLSSISPARIAKAPAERARLYFIICWFHAIVQERLRYQPLGWANSYEFTDADFRVACDTLDSTVDMVAQNRANVKPDKLPWLALRTLLSQCIYGGKIDNDFDQVLLDTLLDKLFTSNSFDADFILIENIGGNALNMPDETNSKDGLINWVINIKALQKPNWIGLPNNAEKVLIAERGQEFIRKMIKMSDDELAYEADDLERNKQAPTWMVQFSGQCKSWLDALPQQLQRLRRTKENVRDPLFRFFEREINLGARLLSDIRRDLNELLSICRGDQKQNNHSRELIAALVKRKRVPDNWLHFSVPKDVTALEWMRDFVQRMEQLKRLSLSENLRYEEVWLGGMFFPEAYITATRQLIAQTNGWSLEQMYMHITKTEEGQLKSTAFTLTDLRAIGVLCEADEIKLTDEVHVGVPRLQFTWTLERHSPASVVVPVYLYSNRAKFLFGLNLLPIGFDHSMLSQRGVAFVSNCSL